MVNRESQERIFYKTLSCYEQEFGAEKITIIFPKSWTSKMDLSVFLPIKVKVWDSDILGIRVDGITAVYNQVVDGM
jgi:hypothetical protein